MKQKQEPKIVDGIEYPIDFDQQTEVQEQPTEQPTAEVPIVIDEPVAIQPRQVNQAVSVFTNAESFELAQRQAKVLAASQLVPKTDHQRLKELKELMIRSGGKDVAQKVIEIALNDDHPHQLVALKMCLDRTLPVSMFEKDKSQRSAVTINITGLGEEPTIIEQPEDVEAKYG